MNVKQILIIVLICLWPIWANAQTLNTDLPLPYLVAQPKIASQHPPVLILMHGYGSNEEDLIGIKDALPGNFLILSVRAPLVLGTNSFQWFRSEKVNGISEGNKEDLKNSTAKVRAFIIAAVKKYHANAAQVYLSGFSQGAMMSYEVGLTSPELLKGIAPLSGRIFESLKPQIKKVASLKKLRIFIGHGDADDRVKYIFALEANDYLKQLALMPVLHSYKNMKHSISPEELKDLAAWLGGK